MRLLHNAQYANLTRYRERKLVTFPSFEVAFDQQRPVNEWLATFGEMTLVEFEEFFDYIFMNRLEDIMKYSSTSMVGYMLILTPMMVALCSKMLEAAHFYDNASLDWRKSVENCAKTWFDFVTSIVGHTRQGQAAKIAWEHQQNTALRFGYQSGAVFETLAPHRIFAES